MNEETKPPSGNGAPPVASIVNDSDTGKVKIAAESDEGQVDLGKELEGDLAQVKVPDNVDPQVKSALAKLRQGTKEGLSPSDHYNLGVAYMGMGLVDDAVREFNAAKKPGKKKAKAKAKAKPRVKAKARAKARPAKKSRPAKKAKAKAKKRR
jgi:valyl-tRNA synthetase